MKAPIAFLHAFAQSLSALALYPEGHVARERALDVVYEKLRDLLAEAPTPTFSFLGDEVVYRDLPLRDLREWDWSRRLAEIGIQRLRFDESVTRDELEEFLDLVNARLAFKDIETADARPARPAGIRFGLIGIEGHRDQLDGTPIATIRFTLKEEAETVRWIHEELGATGGLPLAEAEAVVRGLSVAMHGDRQLVLPLLRLREYDEYTTTHSINVAVLTMALAEWVGMGARDVRAFGVAGLMHDLGKVRVPRDILIKTGKLTPEERAVMNSHPAEGAKIILTSEPDLDLAAVVAYEHHIMINGGGYPRLTYARDCHPASKLVHVCDVYDALRTDRPYRDAWPSDKILAYIEERAGVEFDGEMAHAFTGMIREWEPAVTSLTESDPVPEEQVPADSAPAG